MISIIAALANNRVIGNRGQLPWHLPADLQFFKEKTLHKTIIMGRKTFDSIGKPLPKRRNIVISRAQNLSIPGAEVFSHLNDALKHCDLNAEIMICGGAEIYKMALPLADRMYLTWVNTEAQGDTFFPEFSEHEWKIISRIDHPQDAQNQFEYRFVTYQRDAAT